MTETSLTTSPTMENIDALSTWSVRYRDPSGFECILAIQGETGSEVLKKAEGALSHLTEAKCVPLHKDGHNGDPKQNDDRSGSTVLVKPDGKNPVCVLHGVEMTKWAKNGRTWYSHRWEDGWCNGKQP